MHLKDHNIRIFNLARVLKRYKDSLSQMHALNFYAIMWFTEGYGAITVDFVKHTIEPEMLLFIHPNQLIQLKDNDNLGGLGFIIPNDIFSHYSSEIGKVFKYEIFNRFDGIPYCKILGQDKDELIKIAAAISKESSNHSKDDLTREVLSSLLFLLLSRIKRYGVWPQDNIKRTNHQAYKVFLRFLECIDDNYKTKHTVQSYATELGITAKMLTNYTNECCSMSPLKLINKRLIIEAKRILEFTPLRVKECALLLGFDDITYFFHFFKHNVGMSPQAFRSLSKKV